MPGVSESDRKLVESCRRGDARAWERLVSTYERLVFSIPLNYGLSRDDAADITQITFAYLIQSLDSETEIERLGPWLATVARRHTWRMMDRGRRESAGSHEDLAGSATLSETAALVGKSDADPVERWELAEWLHQGLSLVSEPCRELLLALYFDPQQPSYEEVAARLNRPVGSIGPTRARCLKALKKAMTGS